ncbi:MAG TPA: methylated-DNA--[protein]-cysteine S-methyltransferase [Polyangiales bacterium]|jgi:methylated-DNA-[protein]-cysteine S-methyltransferase|nr:methylated-DNA--[protein]-cysteine S-methyltransferase [Polyangiales bacterium]
MANAQHHSIFETARGFMGVTWNGAGITNMHLPTDSAASARRFLQRKAGDSSAAVPTGAIAEAIDAVKRYFHGEAIDFESIELDLTTRSAFDQKVYLTVRRIGWGRTTTYGDVARLIGRGPQAARDVGQAMAHNPVPVIIPCHRVLAAGGKLGGFSAPGGVDTKLHMLELEGISLATPASKGPRDDQGSFNF